MFAVNNLIEKQFGGATFKITLTDSNLYLQHKNRQKWEGQELTIALPNGVTKTEKFIVYATQGSKWRKVCKSFANMTENELMFLADCVMGDIKARNEVFALYFDSFLYKPTWYAYHKSKDAYREGISNIDLLSKWVTEYVVKKEEPVVDIDSKPDTREDLEIVKIAKLTDLTETKGEN